MPSIAADGTVFLTVEHNGDPLGLWYFDSNQVSKIL